MTKRFRTVSVPKDLQISIQQLLGSLGSDELILKIQPQNIIFLLWTNNRREGAFQDFHTLTKGNCATAAQERQSEEGGQKHTFPQASWTSYS